MSFLLGFFIFIIVGLFIEAVAKEYQIDQKRKLKLQALKDKAIAQEIKARNQQLKDEHAFNEQKRQILLEQIESGVRPDHNLEIIKILLILMFIVLAILIPFFILYI